MNTIVVTRALYHLWWLRFGLRPSRYTGNDYSHIFEILRKAPVVLPILSNPTAM